MASGETLEIPNLESLRACCDQIVESLGSRTVLLLNGPMGAGKTQLTRYIVEKLGGADVSSPTFSLHNIYATKQFDVDHFDLYRMKADDDLMRSGLWESFEKESGLIIVEWASRIDGSDWVPKSWDVVSIEIEYDPNSSDDSNTFRRVTLCR